MRNRRRNTRNGVLIDLTSLLDVIFIILLVVICCYNFEKQKNDIEYAEIREDLSEQITEAKANSQAYTDMIEIQNDLQKYVWVASIIAPYESDEITIRHIKVLMEDSEIISIDLIGNDVADNMLKFKNDLTDYIKKHADRPIIISLNENNEKMLYRDEKAINAILEELLNNYNNVYIKGNISEE